jgi:hypothetical protein
MLHRASDSFGGDALPVTRCHLSSRADHCVYSISELPPSQEILKEKTMTSHSDNGPWDLATPASEVPASDGPCLPDVELRCVLEKLIAGQSVAGMAEWEQVGAQVLTLAERDAQQWRRHASEYVGAYSMAVIEFFRKRPRVAANAASPWGLAVAKGRLAARHAVGAEALCGLTCRDPITHHTRFADAPHVVSLERFSEFSA